MTVTTTDRLIPTSGLREIVTCIMRGRAYMATEPCMRRTEDGWLPPAPLPEDQGLRLSDFLTVIEGLPDPCPELAAANAIAGVIRDRGFRFLLTELGHEWESRWPGPEQETPEAIPADSPGKLPMRCCAQCGEPYRPKRLRSAYCRPSCRQSAYRARRAS